MGGGGGPRFGLPCREGLKIGQQWTSTGEGVTNPEILRLWTIEIFFFFLTFFVVASLRTYFQKPDCKHFEKIAVIYNFPRYKFFFLKVIILQIAMLGPTDQYDTYYHSLMLCKYVSCIQK